MLLANVTARVTKCRYAQLALAMRLSFTPSTNPPTTSGSKSVYVLLL